MPNYVFKCAKCSRIFVRELSKENIKDVVCPRCYSPICLLVANQTRAEGNIIIRKKIVAII